ncbi:10130_t:CDS:1 [Paraglomus occultum]|uniref:10130_t:CDS:1 n=1 Tax=Paraglomus occultum TaxID=144539 RepID=A0A9N9H3S1_9GLOM|nr:10130_t:CDS:1 [Paraglomus occultum]
MTSTNTDSLGQTPINLQVQPHCQDFSLLFHGNANTTSTDTDSPDQMPINLQAQHHVPDISLPLHDNFHMNRRTSGSYYGPVPGVGVFINGQLNTPNRTQVEPHRNGSCPLCGYFSGYFGTIRSRSIVHTFTQMRTQDNVFGEPEYAIIKDVRIQLVVGRVPANASIGQALALTQSENEI